MVRYVVETVASNSLDARPLQCELVALQLAVEALPRRLLGAVPMVWPVMRTAVTGLADAAPRPVEAAAG